MYIWDFPLMLIYIYIYMRDLYLIFYTCSLYHNAVFPRASIIPSKTVILKKFTGVIVLKCGNKILLRVGKNYSNYFRKQNSYFVTIFLLQSKQRNGKPIKEQQIRI